MTGFPVVFPDWFNAVFPTPRCGKCTFARMYVHPRRGGRSSGHCTHVRVTPCDAMADMTIREQLTAAGWETAGSSPGWLEHVPLIRLKDTPWLPGWVLSAARQLLVMNASPRLVASIMEATADSDDTRDHLLTAIRCEAPLAGLDAFVRAVHEANDAFDAAAHYARRVRRT